MQDRRAPLVAAAATVVRVTAGLGQPPQVLARKRAAATMLLTDAGGRVLVVKPTYKPRWELPGGAVEAGESPGAAAAREIAEELGLRRVAGRLLAVDYVPAVSPRTEGLIVVFDGGTVEDPAALRLPADELSDAAFVDPDGLDAYLPALQARRARAALAARDAGHAVYLEDGRAA
ncbi:MAG: NUDIX domain-containing protein [Pseudonocardia sp.]